MKKHPLPAFTMLSLIVMLTVTSVNAQSRPHFMRVTMSASDKLLAPSVVSTGWSRTNPQRPCLFHARPS